MDKIIRTLAFGGNVQVTAINSTDLVRKAVRIHKTTPSATYILGCLLTCGAYLASGIKYAQGSVSITVKAKDADGAVSVSSDALLNVRGYADGACTQTLKGGVLTVVREEGAYRPFVGACEIDSDDVSEIFAKYFQQSEQIPTVVSVWADAADDGSCEAAGGLILQLLPDAADGEIVSAYKRFEEFLGESKSGRAALAADGIIEKYFADSLYGEKTVLSPVYKCNCSAEKIKSVLAAMGKAELIKLCEEQGEVRVHCHYCNRDYVYDKKHIEENF